MSPLPLMRFPRATALRLRHLRSLDARLAAHRAYQRGDLDAKRRLLERPRTLLRVSAVGSAFCSGFLGISAGKMALAALLGLLQGHQGEQWQALGVGLLGLGAATLLAVQALHALGGQNLYGAALGELELARRDGRAPEPLAGPATRGFPGHQQFIVRLPDLDADPADVARVDAHLDQLATMRQLDAAGRAKRLVTQTARMRLATLGLVFVIGMFLPAQTFPDAPTWVLAFLVLGLASLAFCAWLGLATWRFARLLEIALCEADAAAREGRPVRSLRTLGEPVEGVPQVAG